ncbi:MAG TPA: SPFH domain-containing protein [archaeon]|nr:SPFH domain-containing protein [archaeon]
MTRKWGKPDNVIAERFWKDQIPGFFKKELILEGFEVGVAKKYNTIVDVFKAGRHNIKEDFTEVILIDTKPKVLKKVVEGLLTADDNEVSCDLEIRFSVFNPENLVANLLSSRPVLTLDNIFDELNSSLIARVLEPTVKETNIEDLQGNREVIDEIQVSFEVELKKLLEMWGIELLNLSLLWVLPDNYKQYLKSSSMRGLVSKTKEKEYEEDLKGAARERSISKIKGRKPDSEPTTEETKSKLEKESLEKETQLQIRKMESAQDAEEALDALKLKQIMKKQKGKKEEGEEE